VEGNPGAKALSQGFAGGSALVNNTVNHTVEQGIPEARRAAASASADQGGGYGAFGAISGGRSRYEAGVDMSSLSFLAGLSRGNDLNFGRLTFGAFLEYGLGFYDSLDSVGSEGDLKHVGGGLLGRMDFNKTGAGHFYSEGSLRAGRMRNEFKSGNLGDVIGNSADYDASGAYYGLHLGAGFVWNLSDRAALDTYAKYYWTRQAGDSVTLATGDPVNFEAVNSHRARLGGRFSYAVDNIIRPYIGAAYEHEFDGRAKASSYGFAIDAPSVRGGTGMGEIGFSLRPLPSSPVSLDLGLSGYTGKREGVSGSLQVKFEF
jgi:outer membrane autotransporter protein